VQTESRTGDAGTRAADWPGFFRAVAVDFDGTLTGSGYPGPGVLAALDQVQAGGLRVVIVTGRILAELEAVFPDAGEHADLIVAENGGVLARGGQRRCLAAPVPAGLAAALSRRGVACRRGEVLLACNGADEHVVLEEVRRLGLECQLIRNRAELMVLPAGVSKGTGLAAGLAELGISAHNAIAIGDAENDHSLLAAGELGVAVANAVSALKAGADIVLAEADGAGVASFLRGPVLAGRERVHPRRWRITLGTLADGTPASIPASQVNVLVTGVPQRGKSYLAGLISEQLIRLGYSVVIFDPEGDHAGLGQLPGVLVTGTGGNLPPAVDLARTVRHHCGAVVVDLSAAPARQRADYLEAAHRQLEAARASAGLPHWLIIDEAQLPLARDARAFFEPASAGYCLVTHRPEDLRPEVLLAIDILIALPGHDAPGSLADLVAAVGTMSHPAAAALLAQAGPGQAVLVDREHPGTGAVFTIGQRETAHMRHWHKYSGGHLDPQRRFYFRRDADTLTGMTAANAGELEHQLRTCDDAVIVHHCQHGDFSRWVADVLGDPPLAAAIAAAEDAVRTGTAGAAQARAALTSAIRQRYRNLTPAIIHADMPSTAWPTRQPATALPAGPPPAGAVCAPHHAGAARHLAVRSSSAACPGRRRLASAWPARGHSPCGP
jgi:hydroxymethylpyrimidine pyrophosphatase-like HAD family hydrolase